MSSTTTSSRLDLDDIPLKSDGIRPEKPQLLTFDEIPHWLQDNTFIRSGYRPVSNSALKCLSSWTYIHNESVNIYSHLLPAISFLAAEFLVYNHFESLYPEASSTDRMVFAFFLLSAVSCMSLSSAYHTLMNHSAVVSELWLRVDYIGIVGLILGNIVSGTYVLFYCEPAIRSFYWSMVGSPHHFIS